MTQNDNRGFTPLEHPRIWWIQLAAAMLGMLFTAIVCWQDAMPNRDGVLYLLSAELFASGDWREALGLHSMALYPALIALVHRVADIGVEPAACVVNAALHALLVVSFIGAVHQAGGRRAHIGFAAVVILIAPLLNERLADIIRDHGYWAFYLLAVWSAFAYLRSGKLITWLLVPVSLTISLGFRFEAIALLALSPLLLLVNPSLTLGRRWARVAAVYLSAGLLVALLITFMPVDAQVRSSLAAIPMLHLTHAREALFDDLTAKVEVLQAQVLSGYAEEYAWPVLIVGYLLILLAEVVTSVNLFFVALIAYALWRGAPGMAPSCRRLVWGLVGVNLLVLATFVVNRGFLTGRYPVALDLSLLLLTPFALVALRERFNGAWSNVGMAMVGALVLAHGLVSVSGGRDHERQAANWLRENLPAQAAVLSNERRILYVADRINTRQALHAWRSPEDALATVSGAPQTWAGQLRAGAWRGYDYLVMSLGRKEDKASAKLEAAFGAPVQAFEGARGYRVLIFRLQPL